MPFGSYEVSNLPSQKKDWACRKEGICESCEENKKLYYSTFDRAWICWECNKTKK